MNLKHLQKFHSLCGREKKLFFEALFSQYWCKALLLLLPFRKIVKRYPNPDFQGKTGDPRLLEHIKVATARANLLAPWKNRCLVQSLAARRMLSRRGIATTLHFGMTQTPEGRPIAHAWLQAGDFEVVTKGEVEVEFLGESK